MHSSIYCANIGDSLGYIIGKTPLSAIPVAIEDRPDINDSAEKKRIENIGGFIIDNRVNGELAVTRSFGDDNYEPLVITEPHYVNQILSNNHRWLILGTDGLWDYIDLEKVLQLADTTNEAQVLSDLLINTIGDNAYDNIAILVVDLQFYIQDKPSKT